MLVARQTEEKEKHTMTNWFHWIGNVNQPASPGKDVFLCFGVDPGQFRMRGLAHFRQEKLMGRVKARRVPSEMGLRKNKDTVAKDLHLSGPHGVPTEARQRAGVVIANETFAGGDVSAPEQSNRRLAANSPPQPDGAR